MFVQQMSCMREWLKEHRRDGVTLKPAEIDALIWKLREWGDYLARIEAQPIPPAMRGVDEPKGNVVLFRRPAARPTWAGFDPGRAS